MSKSKFSFEGFTCVNTTCQDRV